MCLRDFTARLACVERVVGGSVGDACRVVVGDTDIGVFCVIGSGAEGVVHVD